MTEKDCKSCRYYCVGNGRCDVFRGVAVDRDEPCLFYNATMNGKTSLEETYSRMVGIMRELDREKEHIASHGMVNYLKCDNLVYCELKPIFDEAGLDFNRMAVIHGKYGVYYEFNCSVACKLIVKMCSSRFRERFLRHVDRLEKEGYAVVLVSRDEARSPISFTRKKKEIAGIIGRLSVRDAHKNDCENCFFLGDGGTSCSIGRRLGCGDCWCKCYFHYDRVDPAQKTAPTLDFGSDILRIPEGLRKAGAVKPKKEDSSVSTCASCHHHKRGGWCRMLSEKTSFNKAACDFYLNKELWNIEKQIRNVQQGYKEQGNGAEGL